MTAIHSGAFRPKLRVFPRSNHLCILLSETTALPIVNAATGFLLKKAETRGIRR